LVRTRCEIAVGCEIEGRPGLVLVEAKAHREELGEGPKKPASDSDHSRENAERIGQAIQEARDSLLEFDAGINISRDRCYQFSNRVAFAWKLGNLGIPVALVYLGFLDDTGLGPGFTPFGNAEDWIATLKAHAREVFPERAFDKTIRLKNDVPISVLVRSRRILEHSPAADALWR